MDNEAAFSVMRSALALLGLSYLLFWRYRQFRIDSFRHKMFVLRDKLFDEAGAGLIAFDHPAYGILRSTMNGYIRFGHNLTFWHFLVFAVLGRNTMNDAPSFERAWSRAIAELDKDTKERLNDYRETMDILAMKHVVFGTPEALIWIWPLLIVFVIFLMFKQLNLMFSRSRKTLDALSGLRKTFRSIDDTAYMYGEQVSV